MLVNKPFNTGQLLFLSQVSLLLLSPAFLLLPSMASLLLPSMASLLLLSHTNSCHRTLLDNICSTQQVSQVFKLGNQCSTQLVSLVLLKQHRHKLVGIGISMLGM
jgi:hypothetical protein